MPHFQSHQLQVASLDETLLKHIVEEDIADLSMVQSGHVRNTHTLATLLVSAL